MSLAERAPIGLQRDRFQWSKLQKWDELQTLTDVWRNMPQIDRAMYATMGTVANNPHGTGHFVGDAARIIGAKDIEEFYIGICGSPPMRSERSETASKKRDGIEKTLIQRLVESGVDMGEGWRKGQKLSRMFFALSEIATRSLPEEPPTISPEWKPHYRLEKETFWTWLVDDATLPDSPPFQDAE